MPCGPGAHRALEGLPFRRGHRPAERRESGGRGLNGLSRQRAGAAAPGGASPSASEGQGGGRSQAPAGDFGVGPSRTVLLTLALGAGGWLWVKNERDARQAQVTRDVNEAMSKAAAFREQAKTAAVGGALLFAQAREQAQRALALVENGRLMTRSRRLAIVTTPPGPRRWPPALRARTAARSMTSNGPACASNPSTGSAPTWLCALNNSRAANPTTALRCKRSRSAGNRTTTWRAYATGERWHNCRPRKARRSRGSGPTWRLS